LTGGQKKRKGVGRGEPTAVDCQSDRKLPTNLGGEGGGPDGQAVRSKGKRGDKGVKLRSGPKGGGSEGARDVEKGGAPAKDPKGKL